MMNYLLYGGKVGAYAVEGSNVKGTLGLDENLFNNGITSTATNTNYFYFS